jgi:hypothetical protein
MGTQLLWLSKVFLDGRNYLFMGGSELPRMVVLNGRPQLLRLKDTKQLLRAMGK